MTTTMTHHDTYLVTPRHTLLSTVVWIVFLRALAFASVRVLDASIDAHTHTRARARAS